MLKANTIQTIQIQNPTQTIHQSIIDSIGKQAGDMNGFPFQAI